MDIFEKCEDPNNVDEFGIEVEYPTNTYYPPGTMCSKPYFQSSCFYSGDSGSPLMMSTTTDASRYYMEGLLSYIRGCTLFAVSEATSGNALLLQESQNPNVY